MVTLMSVVANKTPVSHSGKPRPSHDLRLREEEEEEEVCLTVDLFQHRAEHCNMIVIVVAVKSLSKCPCGYGLCLGNRTDPYRQ